MDILFQAKKRFESARSAGRRFISAMGGQITGGEALGEDEATRIRRRAGYCTAVCICSFLLAGTKAPFGTLPFAAALLCSAGHSSAFFVYAGALAGALAAGDGAAAQITVLTLVLVARLFLSPRSDVRTRRTFEEGLKIRLLISGSAALLLGIYCVAEKMDESGFDGLLGFLFIMISLPLMTGLFSSFSAFSFGNDKSRISAEAGALALLLVLIYSLSTHTFFGYSFAVSVSFLIILTVADNLGTLRGGVCGLVCAIASGINPVIFALSGFMMGAFRAFGAVTAVFISLTGTLAVAVYINGLSSVYTFAGDIVFSALVFIPLVKTGILAKLLPAPDKDSAPMTDAVNEERRRESEKKRYAALSGAFEELSETFIKLSGALRNPGLFELRELCESVFDRYCKRCALVSYCRQKNYEDTADCINKLSEKICSKGYLEKSDVPEFIAVRCRNIDKIIWDINRDCADMVEEAVKKDKTELFALDYEAISELLRESGSANGDFELDSGLQTKAASVLRSLGICSMAYGAWGKRRKTILASGIDVGSIAVTSEEIRASLEAATGLYLSLPEFNFGGEFVSMTLSSRRRFSITCSCKLTPAEGEAVSGDSTAFFESVNDYAYSLICDGMGSGKGAASVSGISSLFFEKMLGAGNCMPVTLKLLSNFIRARSEEYHCTADILEVDMLSARASFIKCGAPPSYVLRAGKIFKIDARSMPLGLTREINAEKIEMELLADDKIIMVSDGAAPDLEEALWLPELILSCEALTPDALAEAVSRRARAETAGADDISVTVLQIHAVGDAHEH